MTGDHAEVPTGSWQCFKPSTFAGHVALITGASGGMGARVAQAFHGVGAVVVVTDVDADGADAVANRLGDRAEAYPLDVSNPG